MNSIEKGRSFSSRFNTRAWIIHFSIFLCLYMGEVAIAQQDTTGKESIDEPYSKKEVEVGEASRPIQDSVDDTVPTEAEERELGANENPMAASVIQRDIKREDEAKIEPGRTTGFDVYGSIRARYREQGGETEWQDASSRLGLEADWQFLPEYYLLGRYEVGFNVLARLDHDKNNDEFMDTINTRLLYAGLELPNGQLIVGKNWSPYYEVAAFTDRFEGAGGRGSGTYNALTDGGPTGTGRADNAVQGNISLNFLPHTVFKPFDLNLQLQQGNSIPFGNGADYGNAVTASAVMATRSNVSVGLAYNYASIDLDKNPSLRSNGITGSAQAALVGMRAFGERWYAGLTGASLKNHETTNEGTYFNGWGSEAYGQYRITDRLWSIGGYNILKPDSDQAQAGDFRISYAVFGLRYSLEDFRRMIWANVRINSGYAADGTPRGNVYTIGVRWDMSRRGWHM